MNPESVHGELPSKDKDPAKTIEKTTEPPAPAPDAGERPPAANLTKEEQWALFEKELKENDWGHQPC